jgi:diguanylate cyclase (GGDEF)-like protein/PAS domain S-box-containing protein
MLPANEAARIAALRELEILDTTPEASYDDIAIVASQVCRTPMALMSFVDEDRQWWKARVGIDETQTPRALSFCTHTILEPDQLLVVEDALNDPRFAHNPHVTGAPFIRFYAGAPIVTANGEALGTICVVDTVPRTIDEMQRRSLRALARQTATLLDVRKQTLKSGKPIAQVLPPPTRTAHRDESFALLDQVLKGSEVGLWDLHVPSGTWTVNAFEQAMLGYGDVGLSEKLRDELRDWSQLVDADDLPKMQAAMEAHRNGLEPSYECMHRLRHRSGHWIFVQSHAVIVERDAHGEPVRIVGTHADVTESFWDEDEPRRNAERLEFALSGGDLGLWDWHLQTGEVVRNATWAALFGYRLGETEDAEGLWQSLVHPDDVERSRAGMDRHLRGETPMFQDEVRMQHRDGHWLWVLDRARVVERDEGGNAMRVVGTSMDITERKNTEQALTESERRTRLITHNLPAMIAHVDANERYTFGNERVSSRFGLTPAELIGKTMREVRGPRGYAQVAPYIAQALAGKTVTFENLGEELGQNLFYESQYVPDIDTDGRVNGFYAMTFDISERKRVELRIVETEARLRGITDNMPAMIAEIDPQGRFRFCNETYRTWLGVDPGAVVNVPMKDVVSEEYYAGLRDHLQIAFSGLKVSFEQTVTLAGGLHCLQTTYLPHFDSSGVVAGIYALTSDITELKDTQQKLDALARTDTLTGLANRRQFEERVADAMARTRRSSLPMAVMYLDIDRFKTINDTLGHAAGDAVLVEFARRLEHTVRETDIVARHAGDEFVIVLEGIADEAEAMAVANKVVTVMRPVFDVLGTSINVTTSVGVALFGGGLQEMPALLSLADRALYEAKSKGRDQVRIAQQ